MRRFQFVQGLFDEDQLPLQVLLGAFPPYALPAAHISVRVPAGGLYRLHILKFIYGHILDLADQRLPEQRVALRLLITILHLQEMIAKPNQDQLLLLQQFDLGKFDFKTFGL